MTSYVSLWWPVAIISFVIGMALGFQLASHGKRLFSEWLAVPLVVVVATVLIVPPLVILVLAIGIPIAIGTLVSMALVIAGRRLSDKYKR